MFVMKTIHEDWLDYRPNGQRYLPFSPRLRRKADELRRGDKVLLFLSGRRRIVGAVEVTGIAASVTRLTKGQRARLGRAVPCRTLALLEEDRGILPAKFGLKAPGGFHAWRRIEQSAFIEVLAELARRQRKEMWKRRKAA